jgi:hypothetical protein
MAASKYQAGNIIAYFDHSTRKIVEDEIWLVRQGYYHMPTDDYLHDENIIGHVVDGKRVMNELFTAERHDIIARASRELEGAAKWGA